LPLVRKELLSERDGNTRVTSYFMLTFFPPSGRNFSLKEMETPVAFNATGGQLVPVRKELLSERDGNLLP